MKKRHFFIMIVSMIGSGTNLFGMWATPHAGTHAGTAGTHVMTEMKYATPPAPPAPTKSALPKPKKKKKVLVLPTMKENVASRNRHEARLLAMVPELKGIMKTDDASFACVKSCTDCGGKCSSCSAYERARSKCPNVDTIFWALDERYLARCHETYTSVAEDSAFDWKAVKEVVQEWDTEDLKELNDTEVGDEWETLVPLSGTDVVVEWEFCSRLVSADRDIPWTEATMPEDARLAIDLLQTMFQEFVKEAGCDVGSRESAKRALQAFLQDPDIIRNLAMQAIIYENLRLAGHIKEPLAERTVTVLKEVGVVATAATAVGAVIVRWYKSLTPVQVASLVASAGVSILAPQAKALQAVVILAETLRQLATLYIF